MNPIWSLIPLVAFSLVGISESVAEQTDHILMTETNIENKFQELTIFQTDEIEKIRNQIVFDDINGMISHRGCQIIGGNEISREYGKVDKQSIQICKHSDFLYRINEFTGCSITDSDFDEDFFEKNRPYRDYCFLDNPILFDPKWEDPYQFGGSYLVDVIKSDKILTIQTRVTGFVSSEYNSQEQKITFFVEQIPETVDDFSSPMMTVNIPKELLERPYKVFLDGREIDFKFNDQLRSDYRIDELKYSTISIPNEISKNERIVEIFGTVFNENEVMPLINQVGRGIYSEDVKCKENKILFQKISKTSPACVKKETGKKLELRGWGIPVQTMEITNSSGVKMNYAIVGGKLQSAVNNIEDRILIFKVKMENQGYLAMTIPMLDNTESNLDYEFYEIATDDRNKSWEEDKSYSYRYKVYLNESNTFVELKYK